LPAPVGRSIIAIVAATIGLLLVLVVICVAGWFVVKATPKNIDPAPIDRSWSSIGDFYQGRPDRETEVEFGDGWSSTVDPGAAFEVSWISATRELVVLRRQAHPDFVSGGGLVAAMPRGLDPRATGMKVLAVVDLNAVRATQPEQLVGAPDGLDRLTRALGQPYVAPHPADDYWATTSPPP
jgi:hypothetical protein